MSFSNLSDFVNNVSNESALWTVYTQNFFLALLTLCTVVGNCFIIVTIAAHRQLHRPSHLFLASLAATDLLLALTVMGPRLADELAGKWIFGFVLCQVYHAMDVTLSTSSILHLSCISVDRYLAIVRQPLLYNQRVTPAKVLAAILVCWILSGLTGFVPVFTGLYSSPENLLKARANPYECNLVVNKYFSVLAGLISFWLPGSVMVYVYFKVYRETQRLQRFEMRNKVSLGLANCNMKLLEEEEGGGNNARQQQQQQQQPQMTNSERESRAATTFGVVMGVFLLCWLPFFIWMPLTSLAELETPPMVYSVVLWIGYGNSVVNPFIYGFFSREFREVILDDLRKCSSARTWTAE